MKYFLGIPIQNIPSKPSSLHISPSVSFDISDIISLLYFSYTNKHNIIFTPSHISSSPSSPSSNSIIYFILYGKKNFHFLEILLYY